MKSIISKSDLSIKGNAPPAFDKLVHVGAPNLGSHDEFVSLTKEAFERNWLTNNGILTKELECKIANYHKVKHCIAICNGTVALEIAIKALDLSGEVIVPSFTFIATAHALSWNGITPIFADIDPSTHNLCPNSVKKSITKNTTAIIGVHLWGRPSSTKELQEISDFNNLKLIYDAAHAFGCSHNGIMIGNFGNCEILSFHATKFFNTFEGGAVLTNDDELAEKIRLMRNFGFVGVDSVSSIGTNGKMHEISSAMGLVNLDNIDRFININLRNYKLYKEGFSSIPEVCILEYDEKEINNYHYIVIEVNKYCKITRDDIINVLHAENVLARKYFWPGCHNMDPYVDSSEYLKLDSTNSVAESVIVLPTGISISEKDVKTIVSIISVLIHDCIKHM